MWKGKVISGDSHVDHVWLPEDLFVSNAPAAIKDRMPQVKETPEGKKWFAEDISLGWVGGCGLDPTWKPYVPGESRRFDRMEEERFFSDGQKGLYHPADPDLRIKDQDTDGISGEVLYGLLDLAAASTGVELPGPSYGLKDDEIITAAYDIYNEWVADFCKSHPGRLVGLACLAGHDPQIAARQVRKAADSGLRGGVINVGNTVEPIYHKVWDVVWAAAAECQLPISFHTLGFVPRYPKPEDEEEYYWVTNGLDKAIFQLSGAEYMSSIILSGACDRFPGLKFVLGECGVGWIPYVLHRIDDEYDRQLYHLGLNLKPSEYWHRQGYSTFQIEFVTNEMVSFIGEDNIIWGSDYPHADCVWPDSREVIDEKLGQLDERVLSKIVWENSAKLYGFPA